MYRYNMNTNKNVTDNSNVNVIDLNGTWISKFLMFLLKGGIFYLLLWVMFLMGVLLYLGELRLSLIYTETVGINTQHDIYDSNFTSNYYEFEVDGKKYTACYNMETDYYNKYKKVYYNPENPSENMIFSDWWILILGSGGILFLSYFVKWKIKSYIKAAKSKEGGAITV